MLFNLVKRYFPKGTRGVLAANDPESSWDKFPKWPPDLFAITAAVIKQYDLYTMIACPDDGDLFLPKENKVKELAQYGHLYANLNNQDQNSKAREYIQKLWESFIFETKKIKLYDEVSKKQLNQIALASIGLLIIADESCLGLGLTWRVNDPDWLTGEATWIQAVYFQLYWGLAPREYFTDQSKDHWLENLKENLSPGNDNPYEKSTTCILIPKHIACVQPKIKIPQVGSTLRSISHNLALLPPSTSVQVNWNTVDWKLTKSKEADINTTINDSINILAIPFPFEIFGTAFNNANIDSQKSRSNYFDIKPNWIKNVGTDIPKEFDSKMVVSLVKGLVKLAHAHVRKVDIIIFPEASMNIDIHQKLVKGLESSEAEILIAGVIDKSGNIETQQNPEAPPVTQTGFSGNAACVTFLSTGNNSSFNENISFFHQNKHHRWKLDKSQINEYSLGDRLDPSDVWWENIALRERVINFFTFNQDSCFATLVCEDLARIEPCQDVVRAVGPSLLFALLMDGPQIKGRWSERYAMGLSDDPGSSVLTFTSSGLLKRSNIHNNSKAQIVGLWRDPIIGTRELSLPESHEALLLTLNKSSKNQVTLDGRKSGKIKDITWSLTGITPLMRPK